ncbi:carboxymuconolactone decarboxylase family protein [Actinomadura sp. KC06]|uniref:carboxymuconolactone decarboxylase family protein n=1 Tax=Actinomadura sp. KC06 TaxID=2530369 RepID=UPI00104BC008|nr:carboxymuconolactone decarboxylase family protein [Actinomadura sp. KC06]TDD35515.1 carboxymuconolactone decarboxylase family protein [Actinomadura sp. KC06]
MTTLFARIARPGAQDLVRHVAIVRHKAARASVGEVYAQVERDFGVLAPPVILHSPAPELLAACWMTLRETLVASGTADRAAKEAVASAVSLDNRCPFCVEVHGMTLHGLVRGEDAAAVMADGLGAIGDPHLRSIATWARTLAARAPGGERPATGGGRPAPFPAEQAAELIGTAVVFHYINRMVNVFLSDSPFPPSLPSRARGRVVRVMGRFLRRIVLKPRTPGASLRLLPAAELPADLAWAAGSPAVSGAFARAAAAAAAAGERSVPASVRALVLAELASWNGRPPGIDTTWVSDAVSGLPEEDRPAGRLALLTALASYQVGDSAIEDFRRDHPGDATLIELTAWAAFAAARHIGSRAVDPSLRAMPSVPRPRRRNPEPNAS